jgi:SAM-dependent methyltransferase
MKSAAVFRTFAVPTLAALLMVGAAAAQPAPKPYEPQVGQSGKDVVWVPTPQALVDRMLDMARVTVDDYVIDLGSGDGRTVITAAKRGIRALGIEYNPDLVELSKRNAVAAGVTDLATFVEGDIFKSDFSQATVITLFLLSDLNLKLRPILLEMKPGTRIVSNSFDMGDWEPDDRISAENCTAYCKATFWVIPAKVAGTWQLPQGELTLQQQYQMLTGTLKSANESIPITNGKMRGEQITFMVGDRVYRGMVNGNRMEGVFATETKWQATRR